MALTNGTNLGLLINGNPGEEHYDEILVQWRGFDCLIKTCVIDKDLTAPPGSPANGDVYIVGPAATGAWAGHADHLARWSSTVAAWEFFVPKAGWHAFMIDEVLNFTYSGTAWVSNIGLGSAALLTADNDTALTANSNTRLPTQLAVKTYVDSLISGGASDIMIFKGVISCAADPNYPAGDAGNVWKVSGAGKIGGASGPAVEVGDTLVCIADGSATGNHASVGANWAILQTNLDSYVNGAASSVDSEIALFNGTTGRLIKRASGDGFAKLTAGVLSVRTTAQLRSDLGETVIALTDGATVSVDAALGNNFRLTLGGNRTLANPTNLIQGQVLNFRLVQGGGGGFTLAYGNKYKFSGGILPVLSVGAGSIDFMSCQWDANDDSLCCVLTKAFA